jgi:hypothetical protein
VCEARTGRLGGSQCRRWLLRITSCNTCGEQIKWALPRTEDLSETRLICRDRPESDFRWPHARIALAMQGAKYLSTGNKISTITNIPDSACVLVQLMSDENTNTSLGRELN